jgi:2-oxoglutarate/2-oxoacid ferredoxin oxidoreductase subunit alpha
VTIQETFDLLKLDYSGVQLAERRLVQGNEAISEGGIAAGVRYYAGYPITPCTEIAEYMAKRLPQLGGAYIQMEDEIGSIHSVMGASMTGTKAMTATAGPGISLMQDGIGWTQVEEIPAVIVNVQRAGPGLGNATRSGQMDVMQARWGPNGDRGVVCLAPSNVEESFWVTFKAVNLAERLRTGVIVLAEGLSGLMRQVIDIPEYSTLPIENRLTPADISPGEHADLYDGSMTEVLPFASFGSEYRSINGNWTHNPVAYYPHPRRGLERQDYEIRRLHNKIESRKEKVTFYESLNTDDAEFLLIAFGTQALTANYAMQKARAAGVKVGLLRLVTIWPFPEDAVRQAAAHASKVIVPEMNLGQVRSEVERVLRTQEVEIVGINHVDSQSIKPEEILAQLPLGAGVRQGA